MIESTRTILENVRMLFVNLVSFFLAYFTNTNSFVLALILMFAFNIICGMKADGITITNCKNFKMDKFTTALKDLLIYISIIYVVFTAMERMGDKDEALVVVKALSYVMMYVYMSNGLKNLVRARPSNKAFRIIYHFIRLEFKKAIPERVQQAIDKAEEDEKKLKEKKENDERRD